MSKPTTLTPGVAEDIAPTSHDGAQRRSRLTAYIPATSTLYNLEDDEQAQAYLDAKATTNDTKPTPTSIVIGPADDIWDSLEPAGGPPQPGEYDVAILEPPTKPGGPVSILIPSSVAVGVFNADDPTDGDIILMADTAKNAGSVIIADRTDTHIIIDNQLRQRNEPPHYLQDAFDHDDALPDEWGIPAAAGTMQWPGAETPTVTAVGTRDAADPIFHPNADATHNRRNLEAGLNDIEPDKPDEAERDNN